MNKVLLIGRLVRDPESNTTNSGITYSRFTVAIDRNFGGENQQTDFVPVVAWRNAADFISKYLTKGSLVSVDGRFTSSTFQDAEGKNITRYEVTADRVNSLESKTQRESRTGNTQEINYSKKPEQKTNDSKITFAKEENQKENDVPWDLDL